MRGSPAASAVGIAAPADASGQRGERGGLETRLQLDRFQCALSAPLRLERSIAQFGRHHRVAGAHGDWVRPGLMLYGASPFAERSAADLGLLPAMTFATQVIAVRNVAASEAIGYNGDLAPAKRRRASLSPQSVMATASRAAACGAPALINGREVSVVGRVSMDMIDAGRDRAAGRAQSATQSAVGQRDCRRSSVASFAARSPMSCSAGSQRESGREEQVSGRRHVKCRRKDIRSHPSKNPIFTPASWITSLSASLRAWRRSACR